MSEHIPLILDELPQTVTIKEDELPASSESLIKSEPLEPEERLADGGTLSPQLPHHSVTVKMEVKKEELQGENDKNGDDPDGSKMTMRLRRNPNNPQCVSTTRNV